VPHLSPATAPAPSVLRSLFLACDVVRSDLYVKTIQKVCIAMGSYFDGMGSVPAGNTVGLVGLDQFLIKSGTCASSAPSMRPRVR
jgi:translation elongation factor EF-G